MTEAGAIGFLFFAVAFWPAWVPLAAAPPDTRSAGRRLLLALVAAGLVLGLGAYVPAVLNYGVWVHVEVVNHSIRYNHTHSPIAESALGLAWQFAYVGLVCYPLVVCRDRQVRRFGFAILSAVVMTQIVFRHAFTSVWCFFAALLSLHVCSIVNRLPGKGDRVEPGYAGSTGPPA